MKNLLVLFLLVFLVNTTNAHIGGHQHPLENNSNQKTWYFKDQSVAVKGHFLIVKDGNVYIQTSNNSEIVKKIPIDELSIKDQSFVNFKMNEIHKINGISLPESKQNLEANTSNQSLLLFILIIGLGLLSFVLFYFARNKIRTPKVRFSSIGIVLIAFGLYACSEDDDEISIESTTSTNSNLIENTSIPDSIQLAFSPYSAVTTRSDNDYFYVESNGIPSHQMMVGITAWIAQVPIPHAYSGSNAWSIPLRTKYAENPTPISSNFQRGAIAIASNGIPIFNPINASGLISKDIGELDAFGGHSGRGDDYHYHTAPLHLESTSGTRPIAYALDGYAVYGSTEPDGSDMEDLDVYHGHEYTDSTYHYHGTTSYPYMIAFMRGEVSLEGTAPQNQVSPQPMAFPPRSGNPHPINSDNLIITDLVEKASNNGYVLSYTINGVVGSVDYSWDTNDFFTFIFNDVDGTTTTETFQR